MGRVGSESGFHTDAGNVDGKGCFVARKNLDFLREEHLRQLEAALLEAVGIARRAGISLEEAGELLRLLYEEE